jgi:hypothetical protein
MAQNSPLTLPPNPGVALETNPVVPAQLCTHHVHRLVMDKAAVGEQHDLHPGGQSLRTLPEHLSIVAKSNGSALVLQDPPHQG